MAADTRGPSFEARREERQALPATTALPLREMATIIFAGTQKFLLMLFL
jgi:hypothetical protein